MPGKLELSIIHSKEGWQNAHGHCRQMYGGSFPFVVCFVCKCMRQSCTSQTRSYREPMTVAPQTLGRLSETPDLDCAPRELAVPLAGTPVLRYHTSSGPKENKYNKRQHTLQGLSYTTQYSSSFKYPGLSRCIQSETLHVP